MLEKIKQFYYLKGGVASIEFLMIIPVLLTILLAVIEFTNYAMINRRAELSVNFAADYLSRDNDDILEISERHIVEDIWMIVNPTSYNSTNLRGGVWANGYSRALASVAFVPDDPGCLSYGCVFTPKAKWSFLFSDSIKNPVSLKCDTDLKIVGNTDQLDGQSIPAGLVARSGIVIADFVYPYEPLFARSFIPQSEIHVNAMRRTRSGVALEHEVDARWVDQCND